ncbi:regulatory protein TetR [Xylanimonas cellulosilytica DSM 15894]|uniref:Regulatory protein TetR n=1 Tax=Xylanimonas cellulosilytica (strain DSM 15894 / JCM 12276 / CECT 5975 / KCTC 9989 / LMG 20990 / NBRC 107835 / XIL07) TaxID=446471 RepID=D1BWB4_XYLCX|nr:TetR/AcrR family transcriptional regulator [Xylanimonas cellulosilytica]ACZ31459.1 regulatory protein TetR [Xylanimonas cellulosilytica DSM 15894]
MPTLRADAARSRARILDAARRRPITELRLNDLAREAGVGVATVYRHFPTVTALVEALTLGALEQLVDEARAAAAEPDPARAFTRLVRETATRQLEHQGLQAVLRSDEISSAARGLRDELLDLAQTTLTNAIAAGAVRPHLSFDQVQRLVCGVEHAVRLGDGSDRDQLIDVVVSGLTLASGQKRRDSASSTPRIAS